ncbi:MAG TPA: radical SAM protein [Symbiobacteriaceae bacterium]|nr:radical SAM protein [Symbiobacteriaceae bacterium]
MTLRLSTYAIGLPLSGERELLIHGYTGAALALEAPVARRLRELPAGFDCESSGLAPEHVAALVDCGLFTERSPEQESRVAANLAESLHRASRKRSQFVIMPTYNCNLRCPYCFQRDVRNDDQMDYWRVLETAQIDAIFAAIARLQPAEKGGGIITLYGGEPLHPGSVAAVEEVVRRAEAMGYSFYVVTNGVALARFKHLLGPGRLAHLQITVDGPPWLHDQRRIGVRGNGSFTAIAAGIDLALARGARVTARTNVDRDNLPHLQELAELYHARGWLDHPLFSSYVRPVHSFSLGDADTVSHAELAGTVDEIRRRYPGGKALEHGKDVRGRLKALLRHGAGALTSHYCGGHCNQYIFDAHGNLYACWDDVGRPARRIGTYCPELTIDQAAAGEWFGRSVAAAPACSTCPYALLCGGGCGYSAREASGSIYGPACDDFPAMLNRYADLAYREVVHANGDDEERREC